MSLETSVAVALTFVWLGMVLAISFLEAPLKFRAPNVTIRIGLGIGWSWPAPRPRSRSRRSWSPRRRWRNPRSDKILAGLDGPRSGGHYAYVGLEAIKVIALVVAGSLLLPGRSLG